MVSTKINLGQPNIPKMGSRSRKSTVNKWDSDEKGQHNLFQKSQMSIFELIVIKSTKINWVKQDPDTDFDFLAQK